MNQIFVLTCIVSLALQVFSIASLWEGGRRLAGNDVDRYDDDHHRTALVAMTTTTADRVSETHGDRYKASLTGPGVRTEVDGISDAMNHRPVPGVGGVRGGMLLPERLRTGTPKHSRRLRVLFGILTADFKNDETYRKRHRALFRLWDDRRVCSLHDFKRMPMEVRYECQLVYTFVIAANPNQTTELVDNSRPFEVSRPIRGSCNDLNEPDMTLLNIK